MRVRDVELYLHHDEALSNHIRRENDFFEADILDYLNLHYHNHRVILDIGANLGNHTVYFAQYLKYDAIVAIEPIDANYNLLLQNIHPYENVVAAHVAVGDHEGFVSMIENHSNMGNSRVLEGGPQNIPLTTVDWFKLQNITLMKIDVEGYEKYVLAGAKETIAKWKPLILIEDWDMGFEGYELEKYWPIERTYLYKWKD